MINIQNIINELKDKLSFVLYSKNIEFSLVRLMFLKYAVDNYVGATTVEDIQQCARAQKMFAMRDIENGKDTIVPVLQYIDSSYGLNGVLSGEDNIYEYTRELFGGDNERQRKNIVADDFKLVMDILGSLDLEEKTKDNTLGKELVEALINNITMCSNRNSFSGEYTTIHNLSKLAGKILDVNSDDVFCDFASGIGLSTIEITKEKLPKIVNSEINNTALAISTMLYIMYGYKEFKIFNTDSLIKKHPELIGDKIFVDGPIAVKLMKTDENEYNDSSLAIISRVIHDYLSNEDDSMAVITLPSSPLFVTKKQAVVLREELLSKGFLKAVVALPPMWRGTAIGTNLLVISRKSQDEVVFINAADVSTKDKKDFVGESLLSQERIDLITEAIIKKENIIGFSRVVSCEEIKNNDFNLLPASYVELKKEEDNTTLEEIDEQLAVLYSQLLG